MQADLFVLGSNSISGASFVAHCLEKGVRVVGMSRSEEPPPCFLPYRWLSAEAQSRFVFFQGDLNRDLGKIMEIWDGCGAEIFVNFAAQSMVAESWLHPEHWYQTNVVGNVKLHEALRRYGRLKKYVHISTPEVYGSTEGVVKEHRVYAPSTPYAASRAACDLHLDTFWKRYGFPVVWTRAANVYGPGQQPYRIIPRTILAALTGERMALHGGGHSRRSFIHLHDVAEATWRVAMEGKLGEIYHIATERFISIRELVEAICAKMGVRLEDVAEVSEDRPGKDAAYFLDAGKCREELGWKDAVSLEQGLEEIIAWARQWLETLRSVPWKYAHKE